MSDGDRVRFCDACDAVIPWRSKVCPECGEKTRRKAQPSTPAPEAPLQTDEERLYASQLDLARRTAEDLRALVTKIASVEREISRLEAAPRRKETGKELRNSAALLVDLEEGWSEIQRRYNRQSESIEEEFLEKISAGAVDLELSADRSRELEQAVGSLYDELSGAERRLRETGEWLDLVMARHRSGVLGVGTGARGTTILGILAFALALGGAAWGAFGVGIATLDLALVVGPAWIGLVLLFVNSRAKSL